ncbi:MAG: hypothetical protein ACON5K_04185 [Bacteroidia bacterium]
MSPNLIKSLSIVTITQNNPDQLINTYRSLKSFRKTGGTHIIVNGGVTIKELLEDDCVVLEEPDKGIYDALNKGIEQVKTPFFMLIHSGDILIATISILEKQLTTITEEHLDVLLNDCTIEFGKRKRILSSRNWKPWMFKVGAQPPHPPTIYRKKAVIPFSYDLEHPIIADFKYLEQVFLSKIKWNKGNKTLIHMTAGGATSSGVRSFFHVNKQFRKLKGPIKMIWFALARPFIKFYQMI